LNIAVYFFLLVCLCLSTSSVLVKEGVKNILIEVALPNSCCAFKKLVVLIYCLN